MYTPMLRSCNTTNISRIAFFAWHSCVVVVVDILQKEANMVINNLPPHLVMKTLFNLLPEHLVLLRATCLRWDRFIMQYRKRLQQDIVYLEIWPPSKGYKAAGKQ